MQFSIHDIFLSREKIIQYLLSPELQTSKKSKIFKILYWSHIYFRNLQSRFAPMQEFFKEKAVISLFLLI